MSPLDYTNADWADGAAVLSWVEARVAVTPSTIAVRKRWERWRDGAQASFWHVDEMLVGVGLHVSQLPDAVWKVYDNGRRTRVVARAGRGAAVVVGLTA